MAKRKKKSKSKIFTLIEGYKIAMTSDKISQDITIDLRKNQESKIASLQKSLSKGFLDPSDVLFLQRKEILEQ